MHKNAKNRNTTAFSRLNPRWRTDTLRPMATSTRANSGYLNLLESVHQSYPHMSICPASLACEHMHAAQDGKRHGIGRYEYSNNDQARSADMHTNIPCNSFAATATRHHNPSIRRSFHASSLDWSTPAKETARRPSFQDRRPIAGRRSARRLCCGCEQKLLFI